MMARKRGSRFRKAIDAQEQLEGIEQTQQDARKRKVAKIIERTDKSEQRFNNATARIRKVSEAPEEFDN